MTEPEFTNPDQDAERSDSPDPQENCQDQFETDQISQEQSGLDILRSFIADCVDQAYTEEVLGQLDLNDPDRYSFAVRSLFDLVDDSLNESLAQEGLPAADYSSVIARARPTIIKGIEPERVEIIRIVSANALRKLGITTEQALQHAVEGLDPKYTEEDSLLRIECLRLIEQYGKERAAAAVEPVRRCIGPENSSDVRCAALHCIKEIAGPSSELLIQLKSALFDGISSDDQYLMISAVSSAGALLPSHTRDTTIWEWLRQAAAGDQELEQEARAKIRRLLDLN